MTNPTLQIIIASTRPGRVGPSVAAWFRDRAIKTGDFEVELIDLAEVNLPMFDEPKHPRFGEYVHQHTKDRNTCRSPLPWAVTSVLGAVECR